MQEARDNSVLNLDIVKNVINTFAPQEHNGHFLLRLGPEVNVEECIRLSGYNFTLDVTDLLNNSDDTRQAIKNRKKKIVKVPRPPNSFMIYRRNKAAELKIICGGEMSCNISVLIGGLWKEESQGVKRLFKIMAEEAERRHSLKYPDYKYKPKQKQDKQKRRKSDYPSPTLTDNTQSTSSSPSNASHSDFYPSPITTANNSPLVKIDDEFPCKDSHDNNLLFPTLNNINVVTPPMQISVIPPKITKQDLVNYYEGLSAEYLEYLKNEFSDYFVQFYN